MDSAKVVPIGVPHLSVLGPELRVEQHVGTTRDYKDEGKQKYESRAPHTPLRYQGERQRR
jgi:hypothetical protein